MFPSEPEKNPYPYGWYTETAVYILSSVVKMEAHARVSLLVFLHKTHTLSGTWKPSKEDVQPLGSGI